jgi:hypothetical protein
VVYPQTAAPSAPLDISCSPDSITGLAAGEARLAVYHFSPQVATGLPAGVDIRNAGDNAVLFNDLQFEQVGFVDLPAGAHSLKLTDSTGAADVLTFSDVRLEAGRVYSLFAVGDPNAPGAFVPNAVTSINAQVRLVHAVAGGPNVDVYVDGGATPVLRDVPFAVTPPTCSLR